MAYHSSVGCDRRGDQPTGYATPSTCFHTPEITITLFYEGEGHLIDFIYSIAKWLSPQSYVNSCNLILNTFQNEMSVAGRETICTVGIERFLKHLLGMRIGAPVSTPEIGGFLNSLIRKAAEEVGEEPPVVDLPVFNEYVGDDNSAISGGYRLLLINVGDNA